MTGTEIFKRTAAYDKQAKDIRLLAPHWRLLLAYDGIRTLSEAALTAETSFAEALPLTKQFLDQNWIEECPITLDQYMKRVGAKDLSAGAVVAPAVVLHEPGKDKLAPPATPAAATPSAAPSPTAAPSKATTSVPPPLPATAAPLKPAAVEKALPPGMKAQRTMRLSAVVDFITSLVGNVSLGQLLVYRVFLRVPPDLLMAEDVASVHLVNDTSLIQGEKLQKAIADAVNAVTKRTLPDSVFAPA
jgi:hypothetical protein